MTLALRDQIGYLAFRFDDTHPHPRRRRDYLDFADELIGLVLADRENRPQVLTILSEAPTASAPAAILATT